MFVLLLEFGIARVLTLLDCWVCAEIFVFFVFYVDINIFFFIRFCIIQIF